MARPIRETPILFGEEGRKFEEEMKNAKFNLSNEQYSAMMSSYKMLFACMERGESRRKAKVLKEETVN